MTTHSRFPDDAVPANSPGRQTVRQVMRPPTTIEPGAHLAAAAYLIKHLHDSALVVVTDETHEPVAMITDAEITRAVAHGRSLENTRISQVVTAKPVTVQADVAAEDAARLMLSQGVQHLPVVEGQRLIGVVELAELCRVSLVPRPVWLRREHRARGPNGTGPLAAPPPQYSPPPTTRGRPARHPIPALPSGSSRHHHRAWLPDP